MEVQSIKQINQQIAAIEESLKSVDSHLFGENLFGSESEYTYKSLINNVISQITDVKALIKTPEKFIKDSNYTERNGIASTLSTINSYLTQPNYLYQYVDALKTQLKPFNIKLTKSRFAEVEGVINAIIERQIELSDVYKEAVDLSSQINSLISDTKAKEEHIETEQKNIEEAFIELETKKIEAQDLFADISSTNIKLGEALRIIEEKKAIIDEAEVSVKSSEKLIESFSKKVQEREKKLDEITIQTSDYSKKLIDYNTERNIILDEANTLIENSKKALSYTTAEGLSASFNTQYDDEKNSRPYLWIIAAGVWLAAALGIGIWVLVDGNASIATIIGRVTMIPLPIAAAVFCANMYVKKTNIIQDYAYKMVLAKSIVGFSEQLKNGTAGPGEEYKTYMSKVLGEIHQDPLRRRTINNYKATEEQEVGIPAFDAINKALSLLDKTVNK